MSRRLMTPYSAWLSLSQEEIATIIVLDADKTLAPQGTESLLWTFMDKGKGMPADALNRIFSLNHTTHSSKPYCRTRRLQATVITCANRSLLQSG